MSDERRCPNCGELKERLAGHWRFCGYPVLSTHQRAVLRGLMLAGATVGGNGTNRYVTIGTGHEQLAEWTADQLDWLTHSVRADAGEGDRDTVYRVRTAAHPQCNRYERWDKLPSNSGRRPPDDVVLERTAARVWWAYAGGLQWSGPYDSQVVGTFSSEREERREWIHDLLVEHGYDATATAKRVQLPPAEVRRWVDWIGDPVPGVEYKWQTDRSAYELTRSNGPAEDDWQHPERYGESVLVDAIRAAADARGEPLSARQYRLWRVQNEEPSSTVITERYGSWAAACRAAHVTPATDRTETKQKRNWTKTDIKEALQVAASDVGHPPSASEYMAWRDGGDWPSYNVIVHNPNSRYDSWDDALDAVGMEPKGNTWRKVSTGDVIQALQVAYEHFGREPTTTEYKEWSRDRDVPSLKSVCYNDSAPYDGFGEALEAAGLNDTTPDQSPPIKWSKDEIDAALRACAAELGKRPLTTEYLQWSKGRTRPSYPTIIGDGRSPYSSWSEALDSALGD